jgi:hypothetical protein
MVVAVIVAIENKGLQLWLTTRVRFPAHLAFYPMGTEGFSLGIRGQRREADHSPPSSVAVKNGGAILSLPPHGIML